MTDSTVLAPAEVKVVLNDLGDYSVERLRLVDRILHAGNIHQLVETWHAEDSRRRHAGGRPPVANTRAVLILMLVLALDSRPLHVLTMARLVAERLDTDALEFLGLPLPDQNVDRWHERLLTAFHRVLRVVDPTPVPNRRQRSSRDELKAYRASIDPALLAEKKVRLETLVNAMLEGTWRTLPREVRRKWKGNTTVDATAIRAFSRRRRNDDAHHCIEPDAGLWARDGDHAPKSSDTAAQRARYKLGWDAHFVVTLPNHPERDECEFPNLTLAIGFDKPSTDPAGNTVSIYNSLRDRGHPAGYVAADRAYWVGQDYEAFNLPMLALGHQPVTDYRKDQLGVRGTEQGAVFIEGLFVCPDVLRTNPDLLNATTEWQAGPRTSERRKLWVDRMAELRRFAAKPLGRPDADGFQRLAHPVRKDGKPTCDPTRPGAPTFCRQKSITVSPTALGGPAAKLRQPFPLGSKKWLAFMGVRSGIGEGFNGMAKDEAKQAIELPGRRRVRGFAAQSVMVTLLVAATNMRAIHLFWEKLRKLEADKTRPRRRARRRQHEMTLANWKPTDRLRSSWDDAEDDPPMVA